MNALRYHLRSFPLLFDCAKWISRRLGNQTRLYSFLNEHIPANREVTFIQAGAADGLIHDPYREFILRNNMRGVLVEPLPFQFQALRRNYSRKHNLFFENCALSYPPRLLEIFTLEENFISTHPQRDILALQASASREKFVSSLRLCGAPDGEHHVTGLNVAGRTIEDLLTKHHFDRFDCVFLDLEGNEPDVLRNMNFAAVKPKLIVYEHVCLGTVAETIEQHLTNSGFLLTRFEQDNVAVGPDWAV